MKYNKKGFSIAIAMGLVLVTSLLAYAILEYIVPFSKNIKGIENSTSAFYKANEGIEKGLFFVNNRSNLKTETGSAISGNFSYSLTTTSSGNTLPIAGKGNSLNDKDWNKIAPGEPIQLSIGNGDITNFSNFKTYVRIPDLGTDLTMSGGNLGIINWQLSGENNSLNAYLSDSTNNLIKASDIGTRGTNEIVLSDAKNEVGEDLYKNQIDIDDFYNSNCLSGSGCSLKLSIVNKMETLQGQIVPYLEWKMTFDVNDKIPLRYTTIQSSGVSYGFKKDLKIKVPQTTVSEAFDFTVFQ